MGRLRLLVCLAHPDDEAFPVGGVLASCAARDVDMRLVCATFGEEGDIRQPGSATRESLPHVRASELRCSCRVLGIQEPVMLGYRDSGMLGWEANNHPRAFMHADADEVVGKLVQEVRGFRPQVMLTFEPGGLYGHPDHSAISQHATTAFKLAANPTSYTAQLRDGISTWAPARLFYSARPKGFRMDMALRFREAGIDTPLPSPERRDDGIPPEEIHLELDLSEYVERKMESLRCHFTQLSPDSPYWQVSRDVLAQTLGREHFIRGYPPVEPGSTVPPDFFQGIEPSD